MPPQIPVSGAETIHPNNKAEITPQIIYSDAAKEYINFKRNRMIAARDIRDGVHEEFDQMGFLKWWDMQKKADDQYLAPRKNKTDTSINTGTVRDKDSYLVEYAAKYDFEPVAQVFDDEDSMLEDMAETAEDLVRKSLLMESFKEKDKLITRSQVAFGVALVEDLYVERWTKEKIFNKNARMGSTAAEWTERNVKKDEGCRTKLWDLRKCYPGDIRKFFMNGPDGQPFFFAVEYESYDVTKTYFQDWDRWVNVPKVVTFTQEMGTMVNTYNPSWSLRPISPNYCEIIRYFDPIANEYSLTINGIEMLPILEKKMTINGVEKTLISGFPLVAVSPSGAIPFAKFDLEPMHDFFYSKSQPAKMRVWQDIENMVTKLMLGAFKQKVKPTMGNKSGKNFGPEVTDPAQIINDIRDGDLFPVLPNFQGIAPADFSFYELIKKQLDQNSVERSFQGTDNQPQNETATADMNDMKAASLKVGALIDGKISGMSQLFWLRTYNIAANWTKPTGFSIDSAQKTMSPQYRTVTMPSEIDGGQKATKKIIFTKDTTKTSQQVHQEELDMQKENGGAEVRLAYLHPERFAQMRLKWFYTCVPVPNGSDPLSYMMFAKQIVDAQTFFGPDSLNVKKLKHKFATMTGNDFDTWFLGEQELAQKQQAAAAAASPTDTAPAGQQSTKQQLGSRVGAQPTPARVMQNKMPQVAMK